LALNTNVNIYILTLYTYTIGITYFTWAIN